jgi:hypothetical protein
MISWYAMDGYFLLSGMHHLREKKIRQRGDKGLINIAHFNVTQGRFDAVRSVSKSNVMDFVWSIEHKFAPHIYSLMYLYSNALTKSGVGSGSVLTPVQLFPTFHSQASLNDYFGINLEEGVHVGHVRRSGEDWARARYRPRDMHPTVARFVDWIYESRRSRSLGHDELDQEAMGVLQGHLKVTVLCFRFFFFFPTKSINRQLQMRITVMSISVLWLFEH